jgi:hypothetical protein
MRSTIRIYCQRPRLSFIVTWSECDLRRPEIAQKLAALLWRIYLYLDLFFNSQPLDYDRSGGDQHSEADLQAALSH